MNDKEFNTFKDDFCKSMQESIDSLVFLVKPFKDEFKSDLESLKENSIDKGKSGLAALNQKLDEINFKSKLTNGVNVVKSKVTESDLYKYWHSKSIELISKDKSKAH
jgi:hypothetical protein